MSAAPHSGPYASGAGQTGRSPLDVPVSVTFFKTYAAAEKHEEAYTMRSLAERIRITTASVKDKLPWLKLGKFGDQRTEKNSLRHDANVLAITGIEADYDGGQVTVESACDVLEKQGIAAVVYTSPSHTEDSHRWRVLCPLSAELPPDRRQAMLGRLNGLLGGIFSVESWTLSQSYYYGSVRHNPSHVVELIDGTTIDLHDDLDQIWRGKPDTMSRTGGAGVAFKSGPVDEAELLRQMVSGESYHTAKVRLLGLWARRGVPYMEARRRLVDAMEQVFPPDRDRRWHTRFNDIDRCLEDIYGRQAKADDAKGNAAGATDAPPPNGEGEAAGEWTETVPPPGKTSSIENAGTGSKWGEPVDFLADDSTAPPILEQEHIPAALWPFVTDTAARMGVEPAAVALGALVSCASVISDAWAVQPKRHDYSWTENPRIWAAIVGDPSILKTPVISACTKPIDKIDAEARKRHAMAMRAYRKDMKEFKEGKSIDVDEPRMPVLDRYMVEGTTLEALSEVLRDDDEAKMRAPAGKVLSRHDEMSEFFGGLDRYKAGGKGGSDRGGYLRLYNGGRYTIDRIGRGSFAVPNWSACFLGGCQPGPIQRIARDAADDGMLQRFIYCVPGSQQQGLDRAPDQDAVDRYHALFPALTALHPAKTPGTDHIRPVVFHAEAHQHREDIDALAAAMAAMPDTSARVKASFGKWPGLFARLCLTFHLIETADLRVRGETTPILQIIPENTARQVAAFMRDIVLPHLLRAEAVMFSSDQTGHARWIAGFILAHGLERLATRDITRAYGALRPPEAKPELMSVMDNLVSVAWLEPEEPSNFAKGVSSWLVNPAVHAVFVERRKAEAERRRQVREKIAETVARVRKKAAATATN